MLKLEKRSNELNLMDLPLPANADAERFVLGSILLDDARMLDVAGVLTEQDFSLQKHQRIFATMQQMQTAGIRIDSVTVVEELHRRGLLESVDGAFYLVSLNDGLPRLPNIDSYIKIVRDKSILRQTMYACQALMAECVSGDGTTSDLLSRGERLLSDLQGKSAIDTEFLTPGEIIMEAGGLEAYFKSRRVPGLSTGWGKVDHAISGLQRGHLTILAARTGHGKSAFAANIAVTVARAGFGVALFSLEMDRIEITDRVIALAGATTHRALRGNDVDLVRNSANAAAGLPLFTSDMAGRSVPSIHAAVRRLRAKQGVSLVVVDYLQLLSPAGKFENRTQEVSAMTRGLKLAAQDLRIPFLVLSQLKRAENGGANRRPELSDLRESGSIEQDANEVFFLHWERGEFMPGVPVPVTFIIAKQRSGPLEDIPMNFHRERGLFTENS